MKRILTILSMFVCGGLSAQDFRGEATLPAVGADGFYRIRLTPDFVSMLTPGFANARIVDQQGREVPYLVSEELPVFSTTSFVEYEMQISLQKGCCTVLTLLNPQQKKINNISLVIRNAETVKEASLLGSDDGKTWYALKESFLLHEIDNNTETSEVRILDFPLSNYSSYRLTINDSTTAPLNILRAGFYDVVTASGRYSEIDGVNHNVTNQSEEKQTRIDIVLDTVALFDMLELELQGPPFYHRRATLYAKDWIVAKRKDSVERLTYLQGFDLTSRQATSVRIPSSRAQRLVLFIDNGDSPVLDINKVRLFQLNRYLVAWLKKDEVYTARIGKEDLATPVYDIGYFRDSIPSDPPQIAAGNLLLTARPAVAESFTIFTNRNIIWVAIVVVIALLAYMTRSMMSKMKS